MNIGSRQGRSHTSESQPRRDKEREVWPEEAETRHQTRMKLIREQSQRTRQALKLESKDLAEYSTLVVERMFLELCELNPEWEVRKKLVQQVS